MPHFKKAKFSAMNKAGGSETLEVNILINAAGEFYAHLPNYLLVAIDPTNIDKSKTDGTFKVSAKTFTALETLIKDALHKVLAPTITETPVILFNIESHVAFAEDEQGTIYPNAAFPGASWKLDRAMYGGHHAVEPAPGGYSLIIGAKALLKRTYTYGDKVKVEFESYYKDGTHHGRENPAQLLNSWSAMSLGKYPKEIPYSDEAAMFFYTLLMGMAKLSKQIQEATFSTENLLELIAKQSKGNLLPNLLPAIATGQ